MRKKTEIDNIDYKKIVLKRQDLKTILMWLDKLIELDPTVKTATFNRIYSEIKAKLDLLTTKAKFAEEEMIAEGEMLAALYSKDF